MYRKNVYTKKEILKVIMQFSYLVLEWFTSEGSQDTFMELIQSWILFNWGVKLKYFYLWIYTHWHIHSIPFKSCIFEIKLKDYVRFFFKTISLFYILENFSIVLRFFSYIKQIYLYQNVVAILNAFLKLGELSAHISASKTKQYSI